MIIACDLKIIVYLGIMLGILLLPVHLFRRKWSETAVTALVMGCFLFLNREIINGSIGAYHDTGGTEYLMLVVKEWLEKGIPLGWNPYMSGGEPFYMFSNSFLRAPWVFFCWMDKVLAIDPHVLFNLFWTFRFLFFCSGSMLLFSLLYDDFKTALLPFLALVCGGMFVISMVQPSDLVTIEFFPYVLFGIISFFQKKNVYGIALALAFLGIAMNHYLPHYIFIAASVFTFFIVIFRVKEIASLLVVLRTHYKVVLVSLFIAALAASPAVFMYGEIRDYVSPTRGGEISVSPGDMGKQPQVNAPLEGYRILLDRFLAGDIGVHHAFYFGIIPLLLIPVALLAWRSDRFIPVFALSAAVFVLLGLGNDFWGYRLLVKHVPKFNMIRHSFAFACFAAFSLICLAGYGFREILKSVTSARSGVKETVLVFSAFALMLLVSRKANVVLFGFSGALILAFLANRKRIFPGESGRLAVRTLYSLVILLLFADLVWAYSENGKEWLLERYPGKITAISYPVQRDFYPAAASPKPPDIGPLIFKKAALTHWNDDFMMCRNRRLDDMLDRFAPGRGYEKTLGVDGDMIYFTDEAVIVPEDIPNERFIDTVYAGTSGRLSGKGRTVFFRESDVDFTVGPKNRAVVKWKMNFPFHRPDPNTLEMRVHADMDGFLVRLENFHYRWKAFIDGKETRIYRADYAFQAVRVPQGEHKIVFKFSSIYTVLMYVHVLCAFLVWTAVCFYLFYLNRKSRSHFRTGFFSQRGHKGRDDVCVF